MSLLSEIREQPAVLEKQLKEQKATVLEIAKQIKAFDPAFLYMVSRGTSEHAAYYAQYLFGIDNRFPVVLANPSMSTFYGSTPNVAKAFTFGISQSGKSPDLVITAEDAKKQGSPVVAITNTPDSPLGNMAEAVIDCCAGPEKATAATKSYTTSLMAFAMLSAALLDDENRWADLEKVPAWVEEMLAYDETLKAYAERYVHSQRCVVLGRGYNLASAKEWGLKIQELTYMMAEPYSSAIFQHGPIAMVDHGFPVLSVGCNGKVVDSMLPQMEKMRNELGADIFAITNNDKMAELASRCVRIPAEVPEWLSPIVAIIPAQLFARNLCFARGYDTEKPRTIAKVTETH